MSSKNALSERTQKRRWWFWLRTQVLLAKAEAGHWWRALFEGGEEKGLYQVG